MQRPEGGQHLADEYIYHFDLEALELPAVKQEEAERFLMSNCCATQRSASGQKTASLSTCSVPPSPGFSSEGVPSPDQKGLPVLDDLLWLSQSVQITPEDLALCTGDYPGNTNNTTTISPSFKLERGDLTLLEGAPSQAGMTPRPMSLSAGDFHQDDRSEGNDDLQDDFDHRMRYCSSSGSSHYNDSSPEGCMDDDLLDDEELVSLPVRELNKRLHGIPKEEVLKR